MALKIQQLWTSKPVFSRTTLITFFSKESYNFTGDTNEVTHKCNEIFWFTQVE